MIRVLRVIEYEYVDEKAQLLDMDNWTVNLKLEQMTMRSGVVSVTFQEGKVRDDDGH